MYYDDLKSQAINETKRGGDTQKAIALAILALAEAVMEANYIQREKR